MAPPSSPDWDRLFELAAAQAGHFTTQQAAEVGYSAQLLAHHAVVGRLRRVRRGVYRLVHFPLTEHEDLAALWLWSGQAGVFSHETALALHGLTGAQPAQHHLTLPASWAKRRLVVPGGVVLHFGDVAAHERCWVGPVPVTTPSRTRADCTAAHATPSRAPHPNEETA